MSRWPRRQCSSSSRTSPSSAITSRTCCWTSRRAEIEKVTKFAEYGVATVHEALGWTGYFGPRVRPVHLGSRIGGTAITVPCWPRDNLMIHAAIEQCWPGDILVVTGTPVQRRHVR